ncbi:MAG: ABC transporter ATP-binding protein [Pseudomonadota bacterium]
MLQMTDVQKRFSSGDMVTYALRDFSLTIDEGEFVAVEGPSGAGKTTFLNVAGLLEEMDAGQYILAGQDISTMSDGQRSRIRNEHIGFVFQSFNLISDMTAAANIELPLRMRKMSASERRSRVDWALDQVGLTSRADHFPGKLSGGQQQCIAIARAIAGSPSVLLADEPTGNLDSVTARQITGILERINSDGTTIVMVTHSQDTAVIASRRITVRDGQLEVAEDRAA